LYRKVSEYFLFVFHLTVKEKKIWVHYKDEYISFSETSLKLLDIFNVRDLIQTINQKKIKKVIAVRSGNETLEDNKLIAELHNTKDNALEIIAEENGMHNMVIFGYFKIFILISRLSPSDERISSSEMKKESKRFVQSRNCYILYY